ncbi:hypothetical protein C8J56DRAFT_822509 [Mycena floridula]|nr:hypothetical protein C8J56DRAFT_822509 [Mycena floridula]
MSSHRGRGGYASRTSRPFGSTAPTGNLPSDRNLNEGLKPTSLRTLSVPSISETDKKVDITDLKYLGSYNWVKDRNTPTIIVPGSPAEWQDKSTPYQVPADVGTFFVDQNGFHMPKAVLAPLVTAVEIQAEDAGEVFDWSQVDVVTDRNGLRKLLRWIGGVPDIKPFRIDLQLAGKKTVLFNRWEKRYRENFSGFTFGFNFEKASTLNAKDCEEAAAHHRIVSYDMNGLKLVVRFEVDACIPTPVSKPKTSGKGVSIDELTSSLAGTTITKSLPSTVSNGITILKGGVVRAQSSIVELTTIAERRRTLFDWTENYGQLYLSQTPFHFLAVHNRGRFIQIEKRQLGKTSELMDVADDMQRTMRKLRRALEIIQKLVIEHGERGRLTLICEANAQMKVFERMDQTSCLPAELIAKFE